MSVSYELVPISNILSFCCQFYGHRNVTVLDGGFPKWIKDGYSNSTEIPQVQVKLMFDLGGGGGGNYLYKT